MPYSEGGEFFDIWIGGEVFLVDLSSIGFIIIFFFFSVCLLIFAFCCWTMQPQRITFDQDKMISFFLIFKYELVKWLLVWCVRIFGIWIVYCSVDHFRKPRIPCDICLAKGGTLSFTMSMSSLLRSKIKTRDIVTYIEYLENIGFRSKGYASKIFKIR